MDLENIILNELNEIEKDKYYMISLNMWNLKNNTNEFVDKTETDSQTQKTNLWLPQGKGGGEWNQEYGINRYTLLYIKQIKNKDLLYSTGNYIQYLVITYNEKE